MTAMLERCTESSVLEVCGALRAPLSFDLIRRVRAALRREPTILLDLSRLVDIDAAGVSELVRAFNEARAEGAVLQIAHVSGRVRTLLEISGVLTLLTAGALPEG